MPNSVKEGEFKSPVGFVDPAKLYETPPSTSSTNQSPDEPVDMARYIEHQFDGSVPPP